ncbi:MAG TPA: type I glyceraldehyde-3-phosphate dehydrogenase [candidate division WWE3 bacterium]|uniref:Type I glyceraldehyde-3-phosphate dehydrogenase n=1 Tax=candidate division WWE3 bacterium TaxID=2053526 RepID=A0A7C1NQF7_UNCKA|nr:type I glyceraldehyde-3-phosphate dehydrogenase [candidate division WWE3 bacterium]
MTRVAINGFGRIGRAFFKIAIDHPDLEFVAINDLGDPENLVYLLRYDTVYGPYDKEVKISDGNLVVGGKKIQLLSEKDPAALPWDKMDVDVVVESTGVFTHAEDAAKHLKAGAERVVITAPAKGDVPYTLIGANDEMFKEGLSPITCNASCTTNASVPVAGVMIENPGVVKAMLNTVHGYTATQSLVDGPAKKDPRRGRAAAQNIVPSSTGAAEAVGRSLKEMEGVFDGIALRVPVICGSIMDFTFLAKRKTSVKEINDFFKKAAKTPRWNKVLSVTEEPIVSSDIIGSPFGSIVDLSMTRVVDGDLVKVLAWYDNEWGYSATLVEHVVRVGKLIK